MSRKKKQNNNYPGKSFKQLEGDRARLLKELGEIERALKALNAEKTDKQNQVKQLDAAIKRLTSDIVVSEHAILRYAERKGLIDTEKIRDTILEHTCEPAKTLGSGRFPINDGSGMKAVIRNGVVRTVH